MSFRKIAGLVSLSLLVAVGKLHAQVGVYVGYTATDFRNVNCLAQSGTFCANGTPGVVQTSTAPAQFTFSQSSAKPTGLLLGGYYDFKTYGRVRLGVDFRYNREAANKSASDGVGGKNAVTGNTFLGGVRGTYLLPARYHWFKPYAEAAFGLTSSNVTTPSCVTTTGTTLACLGPDTLNSPRKLDSFFRYEGLVGTDIKIFPILDLRLVELGVGNMNRVGTGVTNTTSSVGLMSIGAGVVFHLP